MSEENQENRLWQINTGEDRNGVPLWPLSIVLMIGAALVGFLTFPCVSLRMDFFLNAPKDTPMSLFGMQCEGEGVSCVCTQQAGSVQGGQDCEFGYDLVIRCRKVGAQEIRK